MKPITLKGKKWLGLKSFDVTFDEPLSIVQGENGAGKTSIADAVRYVLGAPVRSLPAKENGDLGLDGANFSLEMGLKGHELKATKSARPKVAEVESITGVSRKAIEFCLNSDRMLEAKPKELKDLLTEVLSLDHDWRDECVKLGCEEQKVKVLPADPKKAIKDATDRRAASKAVEVEEPEDEEVEVRGGTARLSEVPLDKCEEAIVKKEHEYDGIVGRHASIMDRALEDEDRVALEEELAELEKALESIPDVSAEKEKLQEISSEKAKLQKEHNVLKLKQKGVEAACGKAEEVLGVKLCDKCRKLVERKMSAGQGQDQAIEKKLAKLIDRVGEIVREEGRLGEKIEAGNVEDPKPRIREIKGLLEGQVDIDGLEALKAEMGELQERLIAGRTLRDKIRDYYNAIKAHEDSVSETSSAREEWEAWDKIVKAIPEVEKAGVAAGLQPLRDAIACHKILEGDIDIADDLGITYGSRRTELLSDSERYRVNLVLFFALLELFKFPFVLVDRGDLVVTKAFKAQLLQVMAAMAQRKPVIFLQARADDETKATAKKKVSGIGFYHVAKQTVKRLSA